MRKKLLIVAESYRRAKEPTEPIPAIERYNGVFFRVIRSLERKGKLRGIDVIIISTTFGVLNIHSKIPYYEPKKGPWGFISKEGDFQPKRNQILRKLKSILRKRKYEEIYVNLGRGYSELVKGFEGFADAQITHAVGSGLIPKASHMKSWILSH